MKTIETAVGALAAALWGNWLLFVLLGLGIWCTVLTGFVQVRRLPFLLRSLASSRKQDAGEGRLSSLQALLTAISSCVGSGNIVGVSTAILSGGPGALFWMWVAAFFGMATKFCEIVLGMCYQGKDRDGNVIGGPMYYISHALHTPAAGVLVALLLFVQNAGGTLIQSNTISSVVNQSFGRAPLFTGIFLALVMTFIISGGLRRLVKVAQFVAPFMALLYVAGGLIVILANAPRIPWMFGQILGGAFHPQRLWVLRQVSPSVTPCVTAWPAGFTPTRPAKARPQYCTPERMWIIRCGRASTALPRSLWTPWSSAALPALRWSSPAPPRWIPTQPLWRPAPSALYSLCSPVWCRSVWCCSPALR